MILPRNLLLAAATAAASASVAIPVAAAAPMPKITTKYHYRVELKGVQTTTWSYRHPGGDGPCDSAQSGAGRQTIRFTAKPARMYMFDGISPTMFTPPRKGQDAAGTLSFKLRGNVSRSGSVSTAPLPADAPCADGVGGPQPAPDCGTKKLKGLVVRPEYEYRSDRLVLDQEDAYDLDEPFERCPDLGSGFPYLLEEDGGGERVGQDLPTKDLFSNGQNIVVARGTRTETGEVQSVTKIRWELDFKLVRKEDLTKVR